MEAIDPDLSINLARQAEYLSFSRNLDELEERIAEAKPKLILIDEIQRIPDLLNTIQDLIDRNKGRYRFLLTGSSARKLRRGSANLLPGRLFTYRLGPLACGELDYELNSERALRFGTLPEPYLSSEGDDFREKLLLSYTGTYLQEEILAETMLRDIHGFSRFLTVIAENSGKFLDFSKLANRSKVSRSAARRYYEILEDTLICDRVEAYECDADMVKHPKFYLFDIGVLNGCLQDFSASGDRKGLLFEHLFFNQLKNMAYALDQTIRIHHFRTRGGLEVDFIVQKGTRTIAVELKSSEPSPTELSALKSMDVYFPKKLEKYVACLKCQPKKRDGIEILPWQSVMRRIFLAP